MKTTPVLALSLAAASLGCAAGAGTSSDDDDIELDAPALTPLEDASRSPDAASPPSDAAVDAPVAIDAPATDGAFAVPIRFASGGSTGQRGGTGGTSYTDLCPNGQALIGFSGNLSWQDGYHGQLRGHCGEVGIVDQGGGAMVRVGAGAVLPPHGTLAAISWTRMCPADQVVTGFGGRAGLLVDQLTFRCAPLSATLTGTWTVTVGTAGELEPIGGGGGEAFARADCSAGQVAIGALVRAGDGIDSFALACGIPAAN